MSVPEVLISHASVDRNRVLPLVQALERAGWCPVWDRPAATGSQSDGALDRARCVLVLWSQTSVTSETVLAEADEGRKRQVLVPVLLDDAPVPPAFRSMQAANLVGWTGGTHPELDAVIGAAALLSRPLPTATSLSPRAKPVPGGLLDRARREIHIKIVYCGPPTGAKTRSLMYVYEHSDRDRRGKLVRLGAAPQSAVFFDLRPPDLASLAGFDVRLHLYSVPNGSQFDASRRLMLKGASGAVFVADPSAPRIEENLTALDEIRAYLNTEGIDFQDLPLVFQYDHPGGHSSALDRLRSQLNPGGAPESRSFATEGVGVFETLRTVVRLVLLRANYPARAPVLNHAMSS